MNARTCDAGPHRGVRDYHHGRELVLLPAARTEALSEVQALGVGRRQSSGRTVQNAFSLHALRDAFRGALVFELGALAMLRVFRIAFSAFFVAMSLLLIGLWVRSYWRCDIVEGRSSAAEYFIFGSVRGFLFVAGKANFRSLCEITNWEFDSYPPDYDGRLPEPLILGFHFKQSQLGTALMVRFWFPVLVTTAIAVGPWIGWGRQFSLRTLLVATTLISALLGLIAISR
jgi:hypothetical protein